MPRSLFNYLSCLALLAACGPKNNLTDGSSGTGDPTGDPTGATDATTGTASATTSGDPTVTSTEPTTDGTTTVETTTAGTTTTTTNPTGEPGAGGLDILFVIDNSGSMAEEQAILSQSIPALVDALGTRDFRIAVTTTDAGNPRCPSATYNPENGRFVLSSCVDRVATGEFTFNQADFSFACTDHCTLSNLDLPITPTATALDPALKPRPWLESIGGVTNLPGGVSMTDALRCFGAQGVAGCGFESPLEAIRLALAHAADPSAPEFGFLRDDADLLILVVTDELDCSYAPIGQEIFTTNKVFWNDPNDPAPTSALCFRAGVECVGAPPNYESCAAADKDLSGAVTNEPANAVLRPVAGYVDLLAQIQASKTSGTVSLRAIAGVPVGFEDGSAELVFADSPDIDYQMSFGIGPGCITNSNPPTAAVPPLRLLDVAQALGAPRFYSLCQQDYSAALSDLPAP